MYDLDATIPHEIPEISGNDVDGYDSKMTESIGDDTNAVYPIVTFSLLYPEGVDSVSLLDSLEKVLEKMSSGQRW